MGFWYHLVKNLLILQTVRHTHTLVAHLEFSILSINSCRLQVKTTNCELFVATTFFFSRFLWKNNEKTHGILYMLDPFLRFFFFLIYSSFWHFSIFFFVCFNFRETIYTHTYEETFCEAYILIIFLLEYFFFTTFFSPDFFFSIIAT